MALVHSQKRMDPSSTILIGLVGIGKGLRQYCNVVPNFWMPDLDVPPPLL